MKKIIFLVTFFLLVVFFALSCKSVDITSQEKEVNYIPYYLKVYEADELYENGHYEKSFAILNNLFNRFEPVNSLYHFDYEKYLKLGINKFSKSQNSIIIKNLVVNYGVSLNKFKESGSLHHSFQNSNLNFDSLKIYEKLFFSKLDIGYRQKIVKMFELDQSSKFISKKYSDSIDLINCKAFIDLIKEKGFPTIQKVGNVTQDYGVDLGALLIHFARTPYYAILHDILYTEVKKGNVQPEHLASFIISRNIFEGKEEYFGNLSTKYTVDELIIFNERRKQYGLKSYNLEK